MVKYFDPCANECDLTVNKDWKRFFYELGKLLDFNNGWKNNISHSESDHTNIIFVIYSHCVTLKANIIGQMKRCLSN